MYIAISAEAIRLKYLFSQLALLYQWSNLLSEDQETADARGNVQKMIRCIPKLPITFTFNIEFHSCVSVIHWNIDSTFVLMFFISQEVFNLKR